MIRVELGEEVDGPGKKAGRRHGKWHWMCAQYGVEGFSRQPLLSACRAVKRMDASTDGKQIGLYRLGREKPDLVCLVGVGAGLTVDEARAPYFAKWKPRYPNTDLDSDAEAAE